MIPDDWRIERFADIADYKAGRTPARANPEFWSDTSEGIPWVAISDMPDLGTVTETKERITTAALERVFHATKVPAGTLIMSFKLTIGRVATLGINACHNEAIISIRPKPGVDQRYLGYFLANVDYSALQDRAVKGNTLNQEKIDRIEIWLPPPEEQSAIADVLDLLRTSIEAGRRALALMQQLKRATMRTLFTRGLRDGIQKETEIGPVPTTWDVVQLGSLGRIGNGSTPKKGVREYWNGGTYPWLTSAKVYDREIVSADQFVTESALNECHLPQLEPGSVLIAITGQGRTLGHCGVLGMRATINQHLAYVALDMTRTVPGFVRGYLETQYEYLRQVGSGGGSTKGALTCAFLRTLPIPLPSFDEQREVAQVLDAIDHKLDLHRRKMAALDDLFEALHQRFMTGELRVADLDLSALTPKQPAKAGA